MFIEVSLIELRDIIREISFSIESEKFSPVKIVFVERGGIIPAFLLQHLIGGELINVSASRPKSKLKNIGSIFFSKTPRLVREFLRKIDLKFSKENLDRKVTLDSKVDFESEESILIVDDSLDTGSTIKAVRDILISRGASSNNIKIFVINTTMDNALIEPDIVYRKNVIYGYPWSQDSKEYSRFLNLYKKYQDQMLFPANLWFEIASDLF